MDTFKKRRYPLSWTRDGQPLEPPANAVGWRVRWVRHGGRGFDEVTHCPSYLGRWVPLVLQLRATPEELSRAVEGKSGRYRLDPVDGQGRVLAWPPAYFPVQSVIDPGDPDNLRYSTRRFHEREEAR